MTEKRKQPAASDNPTSSAGLPDTRLATALAQKSLSFLLVCVESMAVASFSSLSEAVMHLKAADHASIFSLTFFDLFNFKRLEEPFGTRTTVLSLELLPRGGGASRKPLIIKHRSRFFFRRSPSALEETSIRPLLYSAGRVFGDVVDTLAIACTTQNMIGVLRASAHPSTSALGLDETQLYTTDGEADLANVKFSWTCVETTQLIAVPSLADRRASYVEERRLASQQAALRGLPGTAYLERLLRDCCIPSDYASTLISRFMAAINDDAQLRALIPTVRGPLELSAEGLLRSRLLVELYIRYGVPSSGYCAISWAEKPRERFFPVHADPVMNAADQKVPSAPHDDAYKRFLLAQWETTCLVVVLTRPAPQRHRGAEASSPSLLLHTYTDLTLAFAHCIASLADENDVVSVFLLRDYGVYSVCDSYGGRMFGSTSLWPVFRKHLDRLQAETHTLPDASVRAEDWLAAATGLPAKTSSVVVASFFRGEAGTIVHRLGVLSPAPSFIETMVFVVRGARYSGVVGMDDTDPDQKTLSQLDWFEQKAPGSPIATCDHAHVAVLPSLEDRRASFGRYGFSTATDVYACLPSVVMSWGEDLDALFFGTDVDVLELAGRMNVAEEKHVLLRQVMLAAVFRPLGIPFQFYRKIAWM